VSQSVVYGNPHFHILDLAPTTKAMAAKEGGRGFPSRIHRSPGTSVVGISIFTALRILDPLLQYSIITHHVGIGFLPTLFGGTLTPSLAASPTNFLDLPPYQLLILGVSIGSSIKQVFWAIFISQQELPVSHAIAIAAFNTMFNSISTVLSSWSHTAAFKSTSGFLLQSPSVLIGSFLYTVGILIETISEIQRNRFKRNPVNARKPYSGGLFGWARNINYGGYALWRSGYAWAAAGPIWGLIVAGIFFRDFALRGVPQLDRYCQNRVSVHLCLSINLCSMGMLGRR